MLQITATYGEGHKFRGTLEGAAPHLFTFLKTPAEFVANYVSLVEKDPALKYEHKIAWDNIVNGGR